MKWNVYKQVKINTFPMYVHNVISNSTKVEFLIENALFQFNFRKRWLVWSLVWMHIS